MIETRTVNNADGSQEIMCVLTDEVLHGWRPNRPLAYEKSVLWLQPIDDLDFVRVAYFRNAASRRGPLVASGVGMVVGYSKLTIDAPRNPSTQTFTRRLFYLKESDLQLNLNQIPVGVLDPKTILPRVEGTAPDVRNLNRGYPWWVYKGAAEVSQPATTAVAPLSAVDG